jgi:hypothetical protein
MDLVSHIVGRERVSQDILLTQEVKSSSEINALLMIFLKQRLLQTWLGTSCTVSIAGCSGEAL